MQRMKLENKLWQYFNRCGGHATPTAGGGTSSDEPDGPDMQDLYTRLFGMCRVCQSPATGAHTM